MTAEELSLDTALLTRIASIEGKVRDICDLIPISSWGFTAEVHEKLRQRKHTLVNKQLTANEKQKLTKSKKQQVARTAGGVCHRVSEVIDLLSASGKDIKSKKPNQPTVRPTQSNTDNKENQKIVKGKKEKVESKPEIEAVKKVAEEEKAVAEKESTSKEVISSDDDSTDEEVESVPVVKSKKRPAVKSAEVEAKKPKFDVKPIPCETKDRAPDIMEQREQAIRKLQEKLKAMKDTRCGKKKAGVDVSTALKFEQERKLKRRMSKMKMKQRRSEQKQTNTAGPQSGSEAKVKKEPTKEEDVAVSFSKFDFLVKNEKKKKRLSTSEKKQKFVGKDYKSLINKVEKREEKLEKLKQKEPEKAAELEHDIKWKRALSRAQGIKVKDNMELLQKGLKRKEKMKEKRKENWANRKSNVEREEAKRQEKRKGNLQKRIDEKKKRKLQLMKKKGRVL
ncbi:surfeit locus protein 6 [Teladorsagia circumcincta]|uniref:Surfeit locus protein 6 n=1 Tax=Teladorsagia circumcincta TaxID=45464 RepID=A0A2G9UHD0_TELCI|nr:surfeit locus protein 6 [Teladorsagia circumcincta]